jgi:hypothetical protein
MAAELVGAVEIDIFCEAIADAMACFMARYVPARAAVTAA